eukprot:COSAG02_NODE_79577_length_111_cov_4.250000_1_plen_36_part_11
MAVRLLAVLSGGLLLRGIDIAPSVLVSDTHTHSHRQ